MNKILKRASILAITVVLVSLISLFGTAQTASVPGGSITGTIILADSHPFACVYKGSIGGVECRYGEAGISTVPLALPRAGCIVKITVCDDRGNPPVSGVVAADPVPTQDVRANESYTGVACGVKGICNYYGDAYYYCGTCLNCKTDYNYYKCPRGFTCASRLDSGCKKYYCSAISSQTYFLLSEPGICCDLDGPDNIPGTDDDNVISGGHCCPKSHPVYDPASGKCIKNATVVADKMGRTCSVLTTTIETMLTEVVFTDSQGKPLSTADYVAVSYVC